MTLDIERRKFLAALGGSAARRLGGAAAWPIAARAQQQRERVRHIGVLTQYSEGDPRAVRNIAAFKQKIRQLGWVEGYNLAIEYRWAAGKRDLFQKYAGELVAAQPDLLMASTGTGLNPLLQATRTIPIVFTSVLDPVASGLIESLARPGGNATGFILFEWSISSKWLDLLKQMAPRITRAAVLRDPSSAGGGGQLGALQAAASTLGIELRPIDSRDLAGAERAIAAFAQQPNGGLIETAVATGLDPSTIIMLAARHRLPAIYPLRNFVADEGGLMSYGPDQVELWRLAAGYVDRVLKGKNQENSRCKPLPSTSWSSILRPPRRLVSVCRPLFWSLPTRLSSSGKPRNCCAQLGSAPAHGAGHKHVTEADR